MNKKFSTLLAAALLGTFSAGATISTTNNQLHQLKTTLGGTKYYLTVTKNKAKTADSLILVKDLTPDFTAEAYKKALWKVTKGNTDNTSDPVYSFTNYATGSVLGLDLSKNGTSLVSNGQTKWLVGSSANSIYAIKGGDKYYITTEEVTDKDENVVDYRVIVKKAENGAAIDFSYDNDAKTLDHTQINGLYGTSSVLDFAKDLEGNPIDGVPFTAKPAGEEGWLNLRLGTNKYLVVDSARWTNEVNDYKYWQLTTDAMPTENAKPGAVAEGVDETLLKNGRSADLYAFKIELNIAAGYTMTITPKAVPDYKSKVTKESDTHKGMSYGTETNTKGRHLVFGKFANSKEVLAATIAQKATQEDSSGDKMKDAIATFGVVEAPKALDPDYTYYVQDWNKFDLSTANKAKKNDDYKKYVNLDCESNLDKAKSSFAIPSYMWYLDNGQLKNMMVEVVEGEADPLAYNGLITLINEAEGIYAFGEKDTLKLTKGPKVEDAQNMGYKVVSKADEVNGALSFRLVSNLANDLYMISKNNKMIVANSELDNAQKLKVIPADEEEGVYETVGKDVNKPLYYVVDRLGKKVLVSIKQGEGEEKKVVGYKLEAIEEGEEEGTIANEDALKVSFLAAGKDNQYKIVYGEDETNAITANAATGELEEATKCETERVIFEFATKDAPTYGAPAIGHVQITTLEDDNKMIANQKDGFAALKSVGQSILKSDEYTTDTLTMWLDTACVTFDETMPLYYISTKTFTPEAETRNFLINPRNFVKDYEQLDEYDKEEVADAEEKYVFAKGGFSGYYAAFNAASVCGEDSIAINGDTIDMVELNPAAIAFEVAAEVSDEAYRIVSKQKVRNYEFDPEAEEGEDNSNFFDEENDYRDLYLAQLNNVLFWTEEPEEAEIFVINRASTPTSNEGIEAESSVKVIAGNGTVTVQGAAGQTVTIATVLGKAVANEVVASDNATIAAPAGVVFVTVNGETTKVVVK
ncbi:DUF6383 domain-containing protein [Parabacteroides sp.]